MEILRRTPWSKIREQRQREQRIIGDCWQWETNGQCVKGDKCSFRHDVNKRGKVTPSIPSPNSFMKQNEWKSSRTRSPRGKSPSGRMSRWPCKDYLRGTCNNSFCEKWHPPECLFYKTKSGCRFEEKCSYAHLQVDEQPTKKSKKNSDKSAVAMLKKGDWYESRKITEQWYKVVTPCMDDHQSREEESGSVGEFINCLLTNCSEMSIFGSYWVTWHFMVCE